jgi:hypothetical protein
MGRSCRASSCHGSQGLWRGLLPETYIFRATSVSCYTSPLTTLNATSLFIALPCRPYFLLDFQTRTPLHTTTCNSLLTSYFAEHMSDSV